MLSDIQLPPKYLLLLSLVMGIASAFMPWARITFQPQSNLTSQNPNPLFALDTPPTDVQFGPPQIRSGVYLFAIQQPFGGYSDQWHFVWTSAEQQQLVNTLHVAGLSLLGISLALWIIRVGLWLFKSSLPIKGCTPLRFILMLPIGACLVVFVLTLLGPTISADYFFGIPYARILYVQPFWPTILLAVMATLTALSALVVKQSEAES
jgi:hypothetical protein